MLTGIDHIVILIPDLDQAIRNYRNLGFAVVPGGEHPSAGTHNALIAFADGAYIELIAFKRSNPQHRWFDLVSKGGGLVDYCMQTDDLKGDMAVLRAAGVAMSDIFPLSRTRPDGYRLDWVLSVAEGAFRGVAPFLIEDITPRSERVPSQTSHPNGVTGIDTVTVAVTDVAVISGWYTSLLNQRGERAARSDLKAAGLRFRIGPHVFDYIAADEPQSPLSGILAERGASIYAVTLKTRSDKTGPLDQRLALNARIALVSG